MDDDEIEANQFAANLLMPTRFLRRDLQELGAIDVEDATVIEELAKKYEVSPHAMTLRLAKFLTYGL